MPFCWSQIQSAFFLFFYFFYSRLSIRDQFSKLRIAQMSLSKCLRGILNKGVRNKSTLNAKGQGVNTCSDNTSVIQFILSGDSWTLYSALSFIFKKNK